MAKLTLIVLSAILAVTLAQTRFGSPQTFSFQQNTFGRYNPNNAGRYTDTVGRYQPDNAGRYSGASDGRYQADTSGRYSGNDGRYYHDDSGKYSGDSGKYVHDDEGYKHVGDGTYKGGDEKYQGDRYQGDRNQGDRYQGDKYGAGQGQGFGSGAGSRLGTGSGSIGTVRPTVASGVPSNAGFGAGFRPSSGASPNVASGAGSRLGSGIGTGFGSGSGAASGFGSGSRVGSGVGSISSAGGFGAPVGLKQGSAAGKYDNRNYAIIRLEKEMAEDGYHYLYETENGITGEEQGKLANRDTDQEAMRASGFFTYTGPDSVEYTVRYTADENGFVPQADHLPTPPPIPDAILRALEYQRQQGTL